MRKKPVELTNQLKEMVITDYKSGLKATLVAERHAISLKSVYNIINNHQVSLQRQPLTSKLKDLITTEYISSATITAGELAKKYKLDRNTVARILKLSGISPADHQYDRKRMVKHNPFTDLEDRSCQYFLGLLASDGFVCKNSVVGLCSNDIDLIKQYLEFINEPVKIIPHKTKPTANTTYYVRFNNPSVVSYLTNLGITAKKSLTLKININITYDFLRGVIDGDGCVGIQSKKYNTLYCTIVTASKAFKEQLVQFLEEEGFHPWVHQQDSKYKITLSRQGELKILRARLYKGARYFLARKKAKFDLIDDDIV